MNNEVVIVYFSATGNTKMVSESLVHKFELEGYKVELISVEDSHRIKTLQLTGKLLGIGFPCYAFDYPKELFNEVFEQIRKQQLSGDSIPIFTFSTFCINPGISMKTMANQLKDIGGYVISEAGFKCPSAGFISISTGREKGLKKLLMKKVQRFDTKIDNRIQGYYERVIKAYRHYEAYQSNKLHKRVTRRRRIYCYEYIPVIFASWNEKRIYKDYQIDTNKCASCRRCIASCPTGNIVMKEGEVVFVNSNNCLRCMRCISRCPQDAITLGEKTVNKMRYSIIDYKSNSKY